MQLDEQIKSVIENSGTPISKRDILLQAGCSAACLSKVLKELTGKQEIGTIDAKVTSPNGNSSSIEYYYIKKGSNPETIRNELDNADVQIKKTYANADLKINTMIDEHEEKIMATESKLNNIYSNLISMMGIFVSIFSLIVINTNAILNWLPPCLDFKEAWLKMLALNIPVVIVIIILLVGIRFIILKDFKGKR